MKRTDWQDVAGGLLMIAIGIYFAWQAQATLALGSLRRLGPGGFPLGIGIILTLLGLMIVLPALGRGHKSLNMQMRTPLVITAAVVAFALSARTLGVVPAIFLCVFVSSLADLRLKPLYSFMLGGTLSVMVWLLFSVTLGLTIPMFAWSF